MHKKRRYGVVALAVGACLLSLADGAAAGASAASPERCSAGGCRLDYGITHVVQIQFDNVHFTRDDPNVPSDVEQIPALMDFLEGDGTILSNDHDVLSHTATNFTSAQTGLYEDRTSVTQSNSYDYFDASGQTHPGVSFGYWTSPLVDSTGKPADTNYNMDYSADRAANPTGTDVDTPAPWVAYTRAGCDVGEVGMANTVLENTTVDVPAVFGAGSPQAAEAAANPTKAAADLEGLAVHCAQGSAVCAGGQTDALPDEPGGYTGYQGLFGNTEVQPAISPQGPVTSLSGSVIADSHGNDGFPGFNGLTANTSLAYAADMLEHGVPVTNVYLSDVHGDQTGGTGDLGPGSAVYEQQLQQYNTAFATFFTRLAADGINSHNTLFVVTTDEGDHFSGSAPTPAGCTGAPDNLCTYATRSEVNVNLHGLLATQDGDTTAFAMHSDPAPAIYVQGNPAPGSTTARTLEREIGAMTVANPLTGGTDKVADYLADPVEEKILHFVGPDAARTPSLTAFSGEDDFITSGADNCTSACVFTENGFAWNHGSIWPDMTTIWMGLAGPGVRKLGVDPTTWADQTDVRPTMLALLGLRDDYQVDGRVLVEDLQPRALPASLRATPQLLELGALYTQLQAGEGDFALDTLTASTRALESGTSADDHVYTQIESQLTSLDNRRDALAQQISTVLLGAAFDHRAIPAWEGEILSAQARDLLDTAHRLAEA
jgi:hypothetical protein